VNYAWSSNAEVAVHRGEDDWTAEVPLPRAEPTAEEIDPEIGIAGRVPAKTYPWFINVCLPKTARTLNRRKQRTLSSQPFFVLSVDFDVEVTAGVVVDDRIPLNGTREMVFERDASLGIVQLTHRHGSAP
jgi:hypothetical protein